MERVREILSYFLAAMAVFTFLSAVYEAMNQRIASSVMLGALMLVAVLLFNFPQLEVLKAFSVEVRLRQTLSDAEDILERLKRLSMINGKVTYMTMAWGNRWGAPTAKEKQAILDEVDQQLAGMSVTADERRDISRPLVSLIGVDFHNLYLQVIERFIMRKEAELSRLGPGSPDDVARRQAFSNAVGAWRAASGTRGPSAENKEYDLAPFLEAATPVDIMDTRESAAFAKLRNDILALYQGCRDKGGYTPAAAAFLDTYSDIGGADQKLKELLGDAVTIE
jgi:hypothetical protein